MQGNGGKISDLGLFGQILLPWVGALLGSIFWARFKGDGELSAAGRWAEELSRDSTHGAIPTTPQLIPPVPLSSGRIVMETPPFCPQLLGTFLCSPPNPSWGCKTNTYLQPGPNSQQLSQLSLMARESHGCVGPSSAGFGQLRAEPR